MTITGQIQVLFFNSQGSEVVRKDRFGRDQIQKLAKQHSKMAIDRHTARVASDVI